MEKADILTTFEKWQNEHSYHQSTEYLGPSVVTLINMDIGYLSWAEGPFTVLLDNDYYSLMPNDPLMF